MSNRSPLPPITLTVNSRLARWLLLEQDEKKKQAGEKAWETPQILSFSAWLRNLWLESWPTQYLLSPLQCEKIWEQIIVQDAKRLDLLHLQGVASQASEAFALIHEYRLPQSPKFYELTDEAKTFISWTRKYKHRLTSLGALDPCMLMDAVKNSMQEGEIEIPSSLCVMGFEEQSPQMKFFLQIIILALVQGLTEFLPISSSAHLILVPVILKWPDQGMVFDVAVHVGTLCAVVFYYRRELLVMAGSWLRSLSGGPVTQDSRMVWYLGLATVPAGLVGLFAGDFIEQNLRNLPVIATTTLVFGLLLGFADRYARLIPGDRSLTFPFLPNI